ncbi:hypothetical protein [Paraflavitalea speifideaquila]|uniref:glutathione peroxidase n=1 Tax=Paraflavitalea speifideaquila TaxID=3076558 RepID=UPI0028ECE8B9|nr:hypothetical protein [Paraflavitalea speifideiaquila]
MFNILYLSLSLLLQGDIYQYSLTGINGDTIRLSDYKGKHILIVNIATRSRYTGQLEKLEQLYQKHKNALVVIAIPSNDFGHLPIADAALGDSIRSIHPVSFLLAAKTTVSGTGMHPLYQWLTRSSANGAMDSPVQADFYKYLVNKEGRLVGVFSNVIDPLNTDLENAINQ